jgi:antitoxin MazE
MNTLRTRLVRIGNSRGLRVPKVLIDQLGLGGEVEMAVQGGQLVIRAATRPREGWDEQFQAMAKRGDDALLMPETATEWDESEWEW